MLKKKLEIYLKEERLSKGDFLYKLGVVNIKKLLKNEVVVDTYF